MVFTTRGGQSITPTRRTWQLNYTPTTPTLRRPGKRNQGWQDNEKREAQMGSSLPKCGGSGRAGVSLSAKVLFDWWLTHDSWEVFKNKLEMPTLFADDEE